MKRKVVKFTGVCEIINLPLSDIAYGAPELWREDEVHLLDLGTAIFLANIKGSFSKCLGIQLGMREGGQPN